MQKNRIEVAGYLGAKPELRYLPSGTKVANARLAEGYRFTDRNNQVQEHTNWHNVTFYGSLAEIASGYEKGDNIFVDGTLQMRKFTPKDGSTRTLFEIIARTVHLIAKPRTAHEPPTDNDPQIQHSAVASDGAAEGEVDGHADYWPS